MRQDPVPKKGRSFLIPLGFERRKGLVTCSGKMVCVPACVCACVRKRERVSFQCSFVYGSKILVSVVTS